MTLVSDGVQSDDAFVIEDMSTGMYASGFGRDGDGRSFSFHVVRQTLSVEIYRPRSVGPVPQTEDTVALSHRSLVHVDIGDARSLGAAVRDAVSDAQPVRRSAR